MQVSQKLVYKLICYTTPISNGLPETVWVGFAYSHPLVIGAVLLRHTEFRKGGLHFQL